MAHGYFSSKMFHDIRNLNFWELLDSISISLKVSGNLKWLEQRPLTHGCLSMWAQLPARGPGICKDVVQKCTK